MRRMGVEELRKGDLILVRWLDASEIRCSLDEHEGSPETICKDWGVFLGVSGRKKKMILVGKDVVEMHDDWGAARIPLELIDEIILIMPRNQAVQAIKEIQTLGRRVRLRKWRKGEIERVKVV